MTASIDTHQVPVRVFRSRRSRGIRALAAVAATVLVAVLAACAPAAEPAPTSTAVEIPDTPVGVQAQWVLEQINAESVADESAFEEVFDPVMFEELSVADLRDVLVQLQGAGPWTPTRYEGTDTQARVRIESESPYDMTVSVADDGRMNGLFFGMPQPDRTPAASWDDLRTELEAAPYDVSLQVRALDADEPEILIGEATSAPIGSIFKLYVLGAVADAVAAGTLTWDAALTIDAEVRSLPSGELQDLPDGSTVTVLEAAQKMIAISDNTATDALIRAVGRDAVVTAMTGMGHADPGVNTPFPATREFFWIGWGDDELRDRWADAAGDVAARTAVLADVPAGVPDVSAVDDVVWPSGIDWFATPDDIVRAHGALQQKAATDAGEPLRGILSENPGIEFGDEWTYVGFKGGSSVGVMAGSWYLERDGAEPVVLTLFARSDDPAVLANPAAVFGPVEDAARLLASE